MPFLVLAFLFIHAIPPSHAYTDIIDTTVPNEYTYQALTCSGNGDCKIICDESNACFGATITCPQHFLCDITCSGQHSCEFANISCPYGASCAVNCNNAYSCQSTTIYAQYSSHFILNDCSTGDLSCNGMKIYFPPNDNGPRAVINGGDHLTSFNERALHFYAIFGWFDIQIINYQRHFEHNSNAFMHCLPDYSETCIMAADSWSCSHPEHTCNAPPTQHPTTSPTTSPTHQPTESTAEPTTNPTSLPTSNPTATPSSNPTVTRTRSGTTSFIESAYQHVNVSFKLITIAPKTESTEIKITNTTYMLDDTSSLFDAATSEPMDVLWIAITLLLSLLCFIMIVLSYYIYPSRVRSDKKEIMEEQRTKSDDINKLILSALAENKNHKYDLPFPQHEDETSVTQEYSCMKEGYHDANGDNRLLLLHKSSLHVHNNPLWKNKDAYDVSNSEEKVDIEAQTNHIYPNGNLSKLHAQSCSHESRYPTNHNYALQNGSNLAGFPYFNYLRPRSEPVSCALNHHLHEQQLSESLFNLQQQRLERSSNHALMVIDDHIDGKSSKPYGNLKINTKKSTFSVELAASKLLSPLSTVTSSSIPISDDSVSDEEDPLHILATDDLTGFTIAQTPTTNASSSDDSSPNVCSSSSLSSNSSSSSTTSEEYHYLEDDLELELKEESTESGHSNWNVNISGDEDAKHTHERNVTMLVKESVSCYDVTDDHDVDTRSARVSTTIGDSGLFESPFNEDENGKTVWTQTDSNKLKVDNVKNKANVLDIDGVRSATLEIQGLISV